MSKRMMVGLWSRFKRQKPNSIIFFVPSVSFLVKSPCIYLFILFFYFFFFSIFQLHVI